MKRDNLTVIMLVLTVLSAAAAFAAAARSQNATRLPPQFVMPIDEITASAKDLPAQPWGVFTSP